MTPNWHPPGDQGGRRRECHHLVGYRAARSLSSDLRRLARRNIPLVTSPGIIEEISRRLAHPRIAERYSITDDDRAAVVRLLLAEAIVTPGSQNLNVARDPTDDKVIAAALEAGADFIVTGDKDLLTISAYSGVNVVTPSVFLTVISEKQQTE